MSFSNLFSVSGKNILVTGSSRGIGLMIASGFAHAGANVLITSRDENACREAVASIERDVFQNSNNSKFNYNNKIYYVASNIGTRNGCKELAEYTKKLFNGRLDVLVNNAGTSWGEDPYERESGRANWGWDKVMDLNVKGMFYLSRECVPMLERDCSTGTQKCDPGRIINIGSIAGIISQEAPTHAYDVSKAAVHHLTKKMAADLALKQITVNAIAPGYIPSRMSNGLKTYIDDNSNVDVTPAKDKIARSIPLKRMGDEDDMAGAAIYLSSKAGAWTTGVILNVDGGACTIQMPLSSL